MNQDPTAASRKADHIELAFESQVGEALNDQRFYYEPMLSGHPAGVSELPIDILGKRLRYPLWVSSMTGGTEMARRINTNLARLCGEFGLGMGLGSCRSLLYGQERLADFDVRDLIGDDLPLYANLGIAQMEWALQEDQCDAVDDMVRTLKADGLIIHINPLQEWMQPEGDRIQHPPIETVRAFVDRAPYPVIVKEVGQGFGPESLRALMRLPLQAIEFAAFGGTNFTRLESLRTGNDRERTAAGLARVGHTASEMVTFVNDIANSPGAELNCRECIISGGVQGFLDGYYLTNKISLTAIYGHASRFLRHARGPYEELRQFAEVEINGLKLAASCLRIR